MVSNRSRVILSLFVLLPVLSTACRQRAESAAAPSAALTGLLSFVFGDPAPGGGQPAYRAWLLDSTGKNIQLQPALPDSQVSSRIQRFSGARVRVTGHFRDSSHAVFVFTRIDSAPGSR